MSEEEQQNIPSEEASDSPEGSDPTVGFLDSVPPSRFLFAYLQQRADSLNVTQSDIEDLLAAESQVWILTAATDHGREMLADLPIWTVDTLGKILSKNLILLRVPEEAPPGCRIEITRPPWNNDDDNLTGIVSASVVRFPPILIGKMQNQAHPLLVSKTSESHAYAVLYDDRYHEADGTEVSQYLVEDIGNNSRIGEWISKATERIIVNNQTGEIVDSSVKNIGALLNAVFEDSSVADESKDAGATATQDNDSSEPSHRTRLYSQRYHIGIGIATIALAGLLVINFISVSLNTLVANGIGLAAFGILIGTMFHGDFQ
jgi:hypothetical protein